MPNAKVLARSMVFASRPRCSRGTTREALEFHGKEPEFVPANDLPEIGISCAYAIVFLKTVTLTISIRWPSVRHVYLQRGGFMAISTSMRRRGV